MAIQSKADQLFEDVENYQQNIEAIMSQDGASPSDIMAAINFQKESLKDEVVKCYKTRSNYANAAEVITAEAKILEAKVKELKARAADFESRAATMDEVIKLAMTAMNMESLFTPLVTIEVKPSTQTVVVDDPESVPDELRNEPKVPEPSKTKLKAYLESLGSTPCPFAHFEKQLQVKYK